MADVKKALETQIKNIEKGTGKTLAQLIAHVKRSGLARHGEIVSMLKKDLGLGHGNANAIAHLAREDSTQPASAPDNPLDALYVGPKAALRPIHEVLLEHLQRLGGFEAAPKKKYVGWIRAAYEAAG